MTVKDDCEPKHEADGHLSNSVERRRTYRLPTDHREKRDSRDGDSILDFVEVNSR